MLMMKQKSCQIGCRPYNQPPIRFYRFRPEGFSGSKRPILGHCFGTSPETFIRKAFAALSAVPFWDNRRFYRKRPFGLVLRLALSHFGTITGMI
jgi:hypothetical protein